MERLTPIVAGLGIGLVALLLIKGKDFNAAAITSGAVGMVGDAAAGASSAWEMSSDCRAPTAKSGKANGTTETTGMPRSTCRPGISSATSGNL